MDTESLITTRLINGVGRTSILVATFNTPAINAQLFKRLDAILTEVERYQTAPEGQRIDGVIFTSSNPKIFLAGADLVELQNNLDNGDMLHAIITEGQELFTRLKNLHVPTNLIRYTLECSKIGSLEGAEIVCSS